MDRLEVETPCLLAHLGIYWHIIIKELYICYIVLQLLYLSTVKNIRKKLTNPIDKF